MVAARWDSIVNFAQFADNDRAVIGETKDSETNVKDAVRHARWVVDEYLHNYSKNRWENQPIRPEVWIEKKALQNVISPVCEEWDVALSPCKGYPSLTFLYEASLRFIEATADGKENVILYFGDYDPSGEDIPRSLASNLRSMGAEVKVRRIALMEEQVVEWGLPPAPAKSTDSRTASWDGLGQVELDAVEPRKLKRLCDGAIEDVFDEELYEELQEAEEKEAKKYRKEVKTIILNKFKNDDESDEEE